MTTPDPEATRTIDLTLTLRVSIYDPTDTPDDHLVGWLIDQLRERFDEAEHWLGPDEVLAAIDLTGHHQTRNSS